MKRKTIKTAIAAFLCMQTYLAPASNLSQQQLKLASLKQSIQSLQHNLVLTQAEKEKIQTDLQSTEQNIGETAKKLHHTTQQLKVHQQLLTQTQTKHQYYQQILAEQEILLQQHLRAAYLLGQQQYVKMLLNQEDLAKISRDMHYYHYLTQARLEIINQIQDTLGKLTDTTSQILQQTQKLQTIQSQQQEESHKLAVAKMARSQLLTTINADISTKQQQLQHLLQDKANLENVLQALQKRSYTFGAPGASFSGAQRKLPWPVPPGRILQAFNQPIADGRLRSTGILIQGPAGTPVKAVLAGKVAFAHWLRGFGLLVIIQHGANYMTLYAHAESLYVKPGDMVKPGDVIATIGDSGGLQQSALYFEIRHQDQPVNPLAWLRAS